MGSNTNSPTPDPEEAKGAFRNPVNDAANRKYRRRSSASPSASPDESLKQKEAKHDGDNRRKHSSRDDRVSSRDRISDNNRGGKYVDEEDRNYSKVSSRSGRESKDKYNRDRSSERDSRDRYDDRERHGRDRDYRDEKRDGGRSSMDYRSEESRRNQDGEVIRPLIQDGQVISSVIRPRINPQRRRDKVYIGCGAGFGGDRPMAALKLLHRVKELNYLVLECLAERTLAERYLAMVSGGDGFDSRLSEWMEMLLPLAVERGTCIITNMGAMDPVGAQEKVIEIANRLGISVTVAVAHEVSLAASGSGNSPGKSHGLESGISTYLGASPIVECLEKYKPGVIITSRVADAALFLGPMVYELGWNWDNLDLLAQGTLAGHLLECGCQLTGGYFMHPGDKHRDMSFPQLLSVSLPFAEVSFSGEVCVAKPDGSGGLLNFSTCAEQLLYEIGDPSRYITPDIVLDIRDVTFESLSGDRVVCTGAKPSIESTPETLLQLVMKDSGWKGWGEISYGGYECVKRAQAAEFLVRSWMEEVCPGLSDRIVSYMIGVDSLKATAACNDSHNQAAADYRDIRLRMDGLFELKEQAIQFTREFTALYTNGPASGGGISTGYKSEILLEKHLVGRDVVYWKTGVKTSNATSCCSSEAAQTRKEIHLETQTPLVLQNHPGSSVPSSSAAARSGEKTILYEVAHSRTGDKGNSLNFSIIPHFAPDLERLKMVITPNWVTSVLSPLLDASSFPQPQDTGRRDEWVKENVKVEIYQVRGIHSLNVVVHNILDGGVNCSRRIDRHGKTVSDLILCQNVVLP